MHDYLPYTDAALQDWASNFVEVAQDHLAELQFTEADLTHLQAETSQLAAAREQFTATHAQAKAATATKEAVRKSLSQDARKLVKRIQGLPEVSPGLKAKLRISTHDGSRNHSKPITPELVHALPHANRTNIISWRTNGNKPSTQYVILAKSLANGGKMEDANGWTIVGQTTKAKFDHQDVVPGMPMAYKVVAARAGFASFPSLPASVYTA